MALSARNHLAGTIEEIAHDTILCHVVGPPQSAPETGSLTTAETG